jgi:hypothetical protein
LHRWINHKSNRIFICFILFPTIITFFCFRSFFPSSLFIFLWFLWPFLFLVYLFLVCVPFPLCFSFVLSLYIFSIFISFLLQLIFYNFYSVLFLWILIVDTSCLREENVDTLRPLPRQLQRVLEKADRGATWRIYGCLYNHTSDFHTHTPNLSVSNNLLGFNFNKSIILVYIYIYSVSGATCIFLGFLLVQ